MPTSSWGALARATEYGVTACLLKNEPASYRVWRVKRLEPWSRSESECESAIVSHVVDPKPGELPMARVKRE